MTDAEVVRLLKRKLRSALQRATGLRRFVFLELFSGSGNFPRALRRRGLATLEVDIDHGECFNVCRPAVRQLISGWIRGRVVAGVLLAPPCASWSPALRPAWHPRLIMASFP